VLSKTLLCGCRIGVSQKQEPTLSHGKRI